MLHLPILQGDPSPRTACGCPYHISGVSLLAEGSRHYLWETGFKALAEANGRLQIPLVSGFCHRLALHELLSSLRAVWQGSAASGIYTVSLGAQQASSARSQRAKSLQC